MDTLKIRAFLAVKKHGSFSKAAEEFNYTPSAFSHIADSLENELQTKLFIRTHNGVKITEQGEALTEYFEEMLNAENSLMLRANELNGGYEIKIGAYSSVTKHFLPKIIKEFRGKNPNIKISFSVRDNLVALLESGQIDVMISCESLNGKWKSVELFTDPFVAVLPKSFAPCAKTVKKEELYNFAFIDTKEKSIDSHLEINRFKEIIDCKTDDYNSVLSLVREGVGIAVLPLIELKDGVRGVATCRIIPEFSRKIFLSYKKEKTFNAGVSEFIGFIEKYGKNPDG